MNTIKVGLLEDNKEQLKERKFLLEQTGVVEVVVWATNSEDFLSKLSATDVDALVLDIDLAGDSMNGIEVAFKFKKPVLFVSGHNAKSLKDIERLKIEFELIVDHITKPFSDSDFIKITKRFVAEVNRTAKANFIYLDFDKYRKNKVALNSIVYLCADKENGAESNNKQVFFKDRVPAILVDFSFTKMEEKGLEKSKFITIHRSFRVNESNIIRYKKETHEIEVFIINDFGKSELKCLPVSENYRNYVAGVKK